MGRRDREWRASLVVAAVVLLSSSCGPVPDTDAPVSVALPMQARSLDPGFAGGRYDRELWMLIYARLIAVDSRTGEIHPEIAEDWTVTGDGLRWRFYLRYGQAFHDGSPVTAEDAARSLRRLLDPRLGSELGRYLYAVSGARELHAAGSPQSLGIEARSDHVLEITLENPTPQLPAILSEIGFITAVADDGVSLEPRYSGVYAVATAAGEAVSLVRNAHSRPPRTDDGAGHAGAATRAPEREAAVPTGSSRRLTILRAGTPARALRLLAEGSVDFAVIDSHEELPFPAGTEVKRSLPLPVVHHLHLNTAIPPTDRLEFRRALIASARITANDIPPGAAVLGGIAARGTVAAPRRNRVWGNEALARYELLRLAGDNDAVLRVARTAGSGAGEVIHAVVSIWRDGLGIESETTTLPRGRLPSAAETGFHVVRAGHVSPYPDAHEVFRDLFHTERGVDWVSLDNSRLDTLLEAAVSETEPMLRRRHYAEAEHYLIGEYAAVAPLYMEQRMTLARH